MPVSVLDRAEVKDWPYPHVVIEDCLPWDLYRRLLDERPSYEAILKGREPGSNKRIDRCAADLLNDQHLPAVWREFIEHHTSADFWRQIVDVFALHGPEASSGIRFKHDADVVLDCQIGVNTPVLEPSRVRGPHVDNPVEIFGGLLYMGEDTKGGDLVIYEPVEPLYFHGKAEIHDFRVRPVKSVRYQHNTFVGFINLPHSVHGVTPREITDEPRWLVNIIAEQRAPAFELPREQDGRHHSLLHRL